MSALQERNINRVKEPFSQVLSLRDYFSMIYYCLFIYSIFIYVYIFIQVDLQGVLIPNVFEGRKEMRGQSFFI